MRKKGLGKSVVIAILWPIPGHLWHYIDNKSPRFTCSLRSQWHGIITCIKLAYEQNTTEHIGKWQPLEPDMPFMQFPPYLFSLLLFKDCHCLFHFRNFHLCHQMKMARFRFWTRKFSFIWLTFCILLIAIVRAQGTCSGNSHWAQYDLQLWKCIMEIKCSREKDLKYFWNQWRIHTHKRWIWLHFLLSSLLFQLI